VLGLVARAFHLAQESKKEKKVDQSTGLRLREKAGVSRVVCPQLRCGIKRSRFELLYIWQEKVLANLTNQHWFAKIFLFKF